MKFLFLLVLGSLLWIGKCEETTTEEGPIVNTPELPSPTSVEPDVSTSTEAVATGFVAVAVDEDEADSDVINLVNSIVEQEPIPDQPTIGAVTTEAPVVTPLELDTETTTELGDEKDDFVKFNKKFKRALKKANLKKAAKNFKAHNKKLKKMKQKKRNFKIGMHPYMHLDDDQIKKLFIPKEKLKNAGKLPRIPTKKSKAGKKEKNPKKSRAKRAAAALPTSFDWRTKNVVNPVRNQGDCGSCWTFSATAVVEINYARKYTTKVDLSEMQLTCVYNESTVCEGGLPDEALEYILKSGGQTTEVLFPYSDAQKSTCKNYARKAKLASVASVLPFGMYKVKQSLIANGPIAFGMLVNDDFMNYEAGIFDTPCTAADEDNGHAMTIVGYGQAGTVPYWIVRNEWGKDWGENGYIRIKAGVDLCNIESMLMAQAKIA